MDGNTLIVAAHDDTYESVFVEKLCWYPVRIHDRRLEQVKWIAAYRGRPISAITSYARITKIEPFLETGRFKVSFESPIDLPHPVELGPVASEAIQGHRYTTLDKLIQAKQLANLKPWD